MKVKCIGLFARLSWCILTGTALADPLVVEAMPAELTQPGAIVKLGRPKNMALPKSIELAFTPSRKSAEADATAGRVACHGGPEVAECQLPADIALDLRIEADGFAPTFRWNVTVKPETVFDLGPIPLVEGASIAGRIVNDGGEPLEAELEASPSTNQDPNSANIVANERLGLKSVTARSDEKGFFQILGLAPGHVDLRAKAAGFLPGILVREVELTAGEAVVLPQTLVLLAPVQLKVQLLPENDAWGNPWQIELKAPPGEEIEPQSGKASSRGWWSSKPTPPGAYLLRILDGAGQPWEMRQVDLVSNADPLLVEVPVLPVRGQVSIAGEPFAGSLVLSRHASMPGIRFRVDEDGGFDGFLPGEGRWLVSLERPSGARQSSIAATEVKKAPGKSYAVVELEIPNTRIVGVVVDSAGKKVPDATVSYFSFKVQSMASVETDSEGAFEIFGVQPGQVSLTAKKDELQSQCAIITVAEDQEGEAQRLVLLENLEIDGLVTSSGAPQAGIRVSAWPEFGSSSTNSVLRQSSGPDGVFHLKVPGFVSQLIVLAQGHGSAHRLLRNPVSNGAQLLVEMDVDRGELSVDLAEWMAGKSPQAMLEVSLVHDGIQLPQILWSVLGLASNDGTGFFRLGLFEAGQYSLCIGRRGDALSPLCEQGFLAPNGTLILRPAASAPEKAALPASQ